MNYALVTCGLVAIAVAILGNRFGAADVEGNPIDDRKEVSRWSGKLVFALAGILLLVIGMSETTAKPTMNNAQTALCKKLRASS